MDTLGVGRMSDASLREALAFYANPRRYRSHGDAPPAIIDDCGEKAREALAKKDKESSTKKKKETHKSKREKKDISKDISKEKREVGGYWGSMTLSEIRQSARGLTEEEARLRYDALLSHCEPLAQEVRGITEAWRQERVSKKLSHKKRYEIALEFLWRKEHYSTLTPKAWKEGFRVCIEKGVGSLIYAQKVAQSYQQKLEENRSVHDKNRDLWGTGQKRGGYRYI